MKEQLKDLSCLLEAIPSSSYSKSFSEINRVLVKYTKILDFANRYNEMYKRATMVYYPDINVIRDNIHESLQAETQSEKNMSFDKARNELRKDILALATLIKNEKELVEAEL